jgi:hypothetical protein
MEIKNKELAQHVAHMLLIGQWAGSLGETYIQENTGDLAVKPINTIQAGPPLAAIIKPRIINAFIDSVHNLSGVIYRI